jgi:hypothetical protein
MAEDPSWKIAVGYVLLVVWCYVRAEIARRRKAAAGRALDEASRPDPARVGAGLHAASVLTLIGGCGLVAWGSGWNVLFWLPAGFILASLIQTLLPIRRAWQ